MKRSLEDKTERFRNGFSDGDRVLVAWSGGVDSTLLLYLLSRMKNIRVGAVTIKTPYIPGWEVEEASAMAEEKGVDHKIIELDIPDEVLDNPPDRCYLCKKKLFTYIREYAVINGFNIITDGTNADDRGDHRPGMKALSELGIRSPLLEAGFTKQEIRLLLKEYGLSIWNKPAYACLLTRLPHGEKIDQHMLSTLEKAEKWLHDRGFQGLRLRIHGNIARIECDQDYFSEIIRHRDEIISYLHGSGIKFITLDLEGYRQGSMNMTE